jgi:hypothetical protein
MKLKQMEKQKRLRELNELKAQKEAVILEDLVCEDNKVTDDEAISKGHIVTVLDPTLVEDCFMVIV